MSQCNCIRTTCLCQLSNLIFCKPFKCFCYFNKRLIFLIFLLIQNRSGLSITWFSNLTVKCLCRICLDFFYCVMDICFFDTTIRSFVEVFSWKIFPRMCPIVCFWQIKLHGGRKIFYICTCKILRITSVYVRIRRFCYIGLQLDINCYFIWVIFPLFNHCVRNCTGVYLYNRFRIRFRIRFVIVLVCYISWYVWIESILFWRCSIIPSIISRFFACIKIFVCIFITSICIVFILILQIGFCSWLDFCCYIIRVTWFQFIVRFKSHNNLSLTIWVFLCLGSYNVWYVYFISWSIFQFIDNLSSFIFDNHL